MCPKNHYFSLSLGQNGTNYINIIIDGSVASSGYGDKKIWEGIYVDYLKKMKEFAE